MLLAKKQNILIFRENPDNIVNQYFLSTYICHSDIFVLWQMHSENLYPRIGQSEPNHASEKVKDAKALMLRKV